MATVRVQRLAAPWALKGEAGARAHVLGELVDKRLQFARAQRGIPGSDMQIELRSNLAGGGRWRAAKQAAETSGNPRRILERGDRVRVTAARPSPDSQYLFVSEGFLITSDSAYGSGVRCYARKEGWVGAGRQVGGYDGDQMAPHPHTHLEKSDRGDVDAHGKMAPRFPTSLRSLTVWM